MAGLDGGKLLKGKGWLCSSSRHNPGASELSDGRTSEFELVVLQVDVDGATLSRDIRGMHRLAQHDRYLVLVRRMTFTFSPGLSRFGTIRFSPSQSSFILSS